MESASKEVDVDLREINYWTCMGFSTKISTILDNYLVCPPSPEIIT